MRVALVQLNSSDDPGRNLPVTLDFVREAASHGARLILTPEVTNCVSASRTRQTEVLCQEGDDPTLAALVSEARQLGAWIVIGSLALKSDDPDGRFVNRSFLISPEGRVAARYDKMHMFDVTLNETETYKESDGYRPGDRAVMADVDGVPLGLTVCYDVRFPYLYRALAKSGARILTVPSAFSPVTGAAHWETLLRARAIETGAFVLAPAQTGTHAAVRGKARKTYGHSLAASPWGKVIAEGGTEPGVTVLDLDLSESEECRRSIPSLTHDRPFEGP